MNDAFFPKETWLICCNWVYVCTLKCMSIQNLVGKKKGYVETLTFALWTGEEKRQKMWKKYTASDKIFSGGWGDS